MTSQYLDMTKGAKTTRRENVLGATPQRWKVVALRDLGRWGGGATPRKSESSYWEGDVPWVSPKDVKDAVIQRTQDHVTRNALAATSLTLYDPGSVMVVFRSGILRHTFPVATADEPFTVNQDMKVLTPGADVDERFAFHLLRAIAPVVLQQATKVGTTVESVDTTTFMGLKVGLPHLTDQRRIAEVLDTVDAAIRQTDAVIAKQQQVKTGLLQDLLTRGLDEHGRLRDPKRHPEQFKDSPLGWIPKAWECHILREIVPDVEYGISSSLDYGKAIPVLRMNNLHNGEVVLDDLKGSDKLKATELLLRPLDVLFNRTNSMEHVGRTGIWRGQIEKASFASYLVRLNPDQERLDSEYLNLWLNLPVTQLAIRQFATPGVSQVNINPTNLRRTLITLPKSLDEQQQIVAKANVQEDIVGCERSYREKLQRLKTGLMQDLLTGKVRVAEAEEILTDALA